MNKIRKFTAVVLMAIVCASTLVGCSGCKSTSRSAYVASGVTHVTVTSALRGWNDYLGVKDAELVTLSKTDPAKADAERQKIADQNDQVADAYKKYQAAQVALLTASAEFSKITPSDPDRPAAADRLTVAVSAATASMSSVVALLGQFGINVATVK